MVEEEVVRSKVKRGCYGSEGGARGPRPRPSTLRHLFLLGRLTVVHGRVGVANREGGRPLVVV